MANSSIIKPGLLICLLAVLLVGCEEDPDFNYDVIPGEYTGHVAYFGSTSTGLPDVNLPGLSKLDSYTATITTSGPNFIVSFDKTFKYLVPDITIEPITTEVTAELVAIKTIGGQSYSSTHQLNSHFNEPPNYLADDKNSRSVRCQLSLKSNDPDSVYFLQFSLYRSY